MLRGKKVIVFGERDDVPAPPIQRCLEAAGADVIYAATSCFV